MPIVFALGIAGIVGLWIGGYPMQQLSSALVSGSQSWVLLAIPAFVFAGNLMERCGMSHALVELARALIGWVKGGLGMSVIVVAYFFSDICGSKMAEVSALGSALMPPMTKAGYDRRDSASLIAAGTAMGMLVPPAIFMIVIAQVTNTSAVALFVAGFVPAVVIMLCLMAVVYIRARQNDWPVDTRPSLKHLGHAALHAAVPMVVPFVILAGFILGIITATEAGAVVAGYAFLAAKLYYRNVLWREMGRIAYDSAILTAAVPGITADDLEIAVYLDTVTLRGNRKLDPEVDGDNVTALREERTHGPFVRTIKLPFRVDADKAAARFERGILTLTLPRPEADKPHKIKIATA